METTLIILSILCVLYAGYCTVKFFKWRKRANAEHFYNKQGQEVSKAEMEAELQGMSTKGIFNHDEYDNQFD